MQNGIPIWIMLRLELLSRSRISRRLDDEGVPVEDHDSSVALQGLLGFVGVLGGERQFIGFHVEGSNQVQRVRFVDSKCLAICNSGLAALILKIVVVTLGCRVL